MAGAPLPFTPLVHRQPEFKCTQTTGHSLYTSPAGDTRAAPKWRYRHNKDMFRKRVMAKSRNEN